ncbi:hypothetical protein FGO68_gene9557 [Halteria grandinella]|uniref:Uncharacterized protein n=1 Tax=Halteria grandinella TaxID=5974 RepID=A0A8J8NAQ8_HALGN|nr:hypothetical protein FGO68_gene9557 [Halteria grandinella]
MKFVSFRRFSTGLYDKTANFNICRYFGLKTQSTKFFKAVHCWFTHHQQFQRSMYEICIVQEVFNLLIRNQCKSKALKSLESELRVL